MIPKHDNPTKMRRDGSWAYAPYNFVPLPEKVMLVDSIPSQSIYTDNTGYIECSLITESPLYTRCGIKDMFLFSWDNVPGSDNEKVQDFLTDVCDVGCLENAEITKSKDGNTIFISKEKNVAKIVINENEGKATLSISDGRRCDLKLKIEVEMLNVYLDLFSEFGEKSFYKLPKKIKKERSQFFHLSDKPLIPGSSLRGMVRALVEIVSYGKVQWVTDKKLIYRGVGGGGSIGKYYSSKLLGSKQQPTGRLYFDYPSQKVRGGYLEIKNGQCYIRPAKTINNETFVHVEETVVNCGTHYPKNKYTKKDLIDVYLCPPAGRIERSNRVTLHLAVVEDKSDIVKMYSKTKKPTGFEKAVVVRSGDMHGKHMHCAIYEPNDKADLIQIPYSMWSLYEEDRDMTRGFETRPLKDDGDPLFYLVNDQDQLVFFGPTMMFRLPYDNPVNHFVPENIRKPGGIDLAESIFGYIDEEILLFNWDSVPGNDSRKLLRFLTDNSNINWVANADISKSDDDKTILTSIGDNSAKIVIDDKKEKAILKLSDGRILNLNIKTENSKLNIYYNTARAGRVFFTDAKYKSAENEICARDEPITPKVLSSPKPTSFQHYLVQERNKNYSPDDKNLLAHYGTPSPNETVIRGSKMYWHKNDISLEDIKANQMDEDKTKKQNTSIKPVNTKVTFSFRIYFDNLCKDELGALLWVLTLPGEEGKQYRHKLGMGKPLGMGTVKIEPKLYMSNQIRRYKQLFDGNNWAESVSSDDPEPFIRCFEGFTLDFLKLGGDDLKGVERIKMLLKMLEWHGHETELTRYLKSIGTNEYKERPVLPDPLNVKRH